MSKLEEIDAQIEALRAARALLVDRKKKDIVLIDIGSGKDVWVEIFAENDTYSVAWSKILLSTKKALIEELRR